MSYPKQQSNALVNSNLSPLPNEVLWHIIHKLELKDIHNFSFTCKAIHAIVMATPALALPVTFPWQDINASYTRAVFRIRGQLSIPLLSEYEPHPEDTLIQMTETHSDASNCYHDIIIDLSNDNSDSDGNGDELSASDYDEELRLELNKQDEEIDGQILLAAFGEKPTVPTFGSMVRFYQTPVIQQYKKLLPFEMILTILLCHENLPDDKQDYFKQVLLAICQEHYGTNAVSQFLGNQNPYTTDILRFAILFAYYWTRRNATNIQSIAMANVALGLTSLKPMEDIAKEAIHAAHTTGLVMRHIQATHGVNTLQDDCSLCSTTMAILVMVLTLVGISSAFALIVRAFPHTNSQASSMESSSNSTITVDLSPKTVNMHQIFAGFGILLGVLALCIGTSFYYVWIKNRAQAFATSHEGEAHELTQLLTGNGSPSLLAYTTSEGSKDDEELSDPDLEMGESDRHGLGTGG